MSSPSVEVMRMRRRSSPKRDRVCPVCERKVAYLRTYPARWLPDVFKSEPDRLMCRRCITRYHSQRAKGIETHDTACMLIRLSDEIGRCFRSA